MTLNVLIYAEEPDLAAELLLRVEGAGPFTAFPINGGDSEYDPQIPAGDVAVIVPSGNSKKNESLLAKLDEKNVPAIVLGRLNAADDKLPHHLLDSKDYSALMSRLHHLSSGDTDIGQAAAPPSAGPIPGPRDAIAEKP